MPSQQEIVDAVARQLQSKDLSQQAVMVLQRATGRVLERIKQNVDAQVKEDSSPIVEEFVRNVATKLSAMTQQWADGVRNDLVVFPEGTRYIWRDGAMTTIVVEQQPQVRHVKVDGKVYLLAMPYVQFILPFKNHQALGNVFVGCTKKPISDLDVPICNLPLPNVQNHTVCMGNCPLPKDKNMNDQVNTLIGNFWQSEFNQNHNADYFAFLTEMGWINPGVKEPNGSHRGLSAWEEETKRQPMFMIEKTTKLKPGGTIRRFLASDAGDKNGSQSIVNKLKAEIIAAVGAIGGDIQALLTGVDLKTENREKAHVETLQNILKEIIVQAYAELWEYLQKQLQDERAKLQQEMQLAASKLKNDFVYYMEQKKKVW
jgi:hypothetical protein